MTTKKVGDPTKADKDAAKEAVQKALEAKNRASKRLALCKKPESVKAAKQAYAEASEAYRKAARHRDELFGYVVLAEKVREKVGILAGLSLSLDELTLVLEGLDSYRYWQLSDELYRHDGHVRDPGSDDPEKREQIEQVNLLEEKLEAIRAALQKQVEDD